MARVSVYNMGGDPVGEVELRDDIFGVAANPAVLHEAVVMHLANRRRGTHDTKTRAEVSGGGRKPWRQKGTGRARHGSIRSPIWRGGGIVFGPHPRDYGYRLPKKVRRLALKFALSEKVRAGELVVIDTFALPAPKTKEALKFLARFEASGGALLVGAAPSREMKLAVANITGVKFVPVTNLNVYDILRYPKLIVTREALARIEEALK
ncbi:LSU ribosomal protein L4P [Thermodesulfitimonas autotrophica]|uniref:Large ribosomal subunit protein uL4 n=1 Tax=Thermodesulfitimonas autotrophica TaxID=1894989 RepID=A0A3N5AZZ8_9THEO|nr:50S ribosomal protein L4 [Thermodesulfitimonas autotrophica]RPF42768.1 LSU ribosomal protein L4P [Thermodesulfitimonas autotrophica]